MIEVARYGTGREEGEQKQWEKLETKEREHKVKEERERRPDVTHSNRN